MKPVVAITVGDYNGIGPEVALKAVLQPGIWQKCTPLLVGPEDVFVRTAKQLRQKVVLRSVHADVSLRHAGGSRRSLLFTDEGFAGHTHWSPGRVTKHAGEIAGRAIVTAVRLAMQGTAHAVVTAPISKKGLHLAGYRFPGQTEFVQHLTQSKRVAMILASRDMKVGLVTIHVPVRKISGLLSRRVIAAKISTIHESLKMDWGIRSPNIAVLGLNPHAGEHGDIGTEDADLIAPVVRRLRKRGMNISGPFPADAFFGRYKSGEYDGIVAMYHDQGLIPLKMSSFGSGVNISAGLRIVRTSPDHGTAYDIAGMGNADPGSMIEAILLAAKVARNRKLTIKGPR